ncbi:glyoxalase [Saccharothrix sp. NRRL B-16348]|uniref:VOC family protein n=1 Tax=Saccharothrix sp. NRRL B-16348 TaxID=1415542 RepID=UPI0006AE42C5|nr:VOC family protein [Saccharothrix sp. NRRL B-16348]KOX21368.1 glyoxalase [Saccharothrix sp. NRRL B-16348]
MAHTIGLALDCHHPTQLAEFWKLALGYEDEPPPPPFKTRAEWVAHYDDPDDDQDDGAWLHDPAGVGPKLFLQQVREPKTEKIRLHLDVRVSLEVPAEERWSAVKAKVGLLLAAGGSVMQEYPEHHVVMADPEGNEFCVC